MLSPVCSFHGQTLLLTLPTEWLSAVPHEERRCCESDGVNARKSGGDHAQAATVPQLGHRLAEQHTGRLHQPAVVARDPEI